MQHPLTLSTSVSESVRPRRSLRHSLRLSVWEGVAAELVAACSGVAVLTAWALHFNAGPLLLGIIVSLSQFSQWVQLPAAWVTSRFGARRTAIVAVAASRQILLPLAFLGILPCSEELRCGVLIAVALAASLLGVIGNNAWTVWMGDLVPRTIRGRYFGRRTAVCTAANASAALGAGLFLDFAKARGFEAEALSALALGACLAGAWSTWLMSRQGDGREATAPIEFDIQHVKAPWKDRAARPLLAYQLVWNGAVGLAGSFFTVFMVNELHMGFAAVALHGALTAAFRVFAAPRWGRVIDEFGAKPVLVFCSFAIAILPLLWVTATPQSMWLVWCDPLLAGVLWGGHAQAIFQLPLAIAPRRERSFYLASFALSGGVAFALATSFAGVLASLLPAGATIGSSHWGRFQLLFVLSALARLGAATFSRRLVGGEGRVVGLPPAWLGLRVTFFGSQNRAN